jgi:hypothetical protein
LQERYEKVINWVVVQRIYSGVMLYVPRRKISTAHDPGGFPLAQRAGQV